ncbi:hypothetical protein ACFVJK_32330 [Streptomyces sp. NPDC127172]|jgi:L-serine deaminase|uniref:hypothetical protein n=1 Tax=Streptomyces sp. NPDC127172 TaxID=3345382 RepID=UPI0036364B7C
MGPQPVRVGPASRRTVGPMRAARGFVGRRAGHPPVHGSLAQVITTMRDTGRDMKATCQEAARGCLAANVTEWLAP